MANREAGRSKRSASPGPKESSPVRKAPVRSPIQGVMEFWSETEIAPALAAQLARLRPKPCYREPYVLVLSDGTKYPNKSYLWRVEVARSATDKGKPGARLERWCAANARVIRAAKSAGLDVRATLECYVRHILFYVPVDPKLVARLDQLGVPLRMAFHR